MKAVKAVFLAMVAVGVLFMSCAHEVTTYNGILAESFLTTGDGRNITFASSTPLGYYVDSDINFSSMDDVLFTRTGQGDWAGMRWTAWFVPPETGVYQFRSYSDNGTRLWIGGNPGNTAEALIDYWDSGWWWDNPGTPTEWSRGISLEGGKAYRFRLDYFDAHGGSGIRLVWQNDKGMPESVVPSSAFFLPNAYSGPRVGSMDVSTAQLDLDKGDTGGLIAVKGSNLSKVTARLMTSGGRLVGPLEINDQSNSSVRVKVPGGLKAGLYAIEFTGGGFTISATNTFFVSVDNGQLAERPEHPRPDWQRGQWVSLNGWWDFNYDPSSVGLSQNWQDSHEFTQKINVPFGWTTELSGNTNAYYRGEAWYQKTFTVDGDWTADGKQVYVYFGAVDNWSRVFVNGHELEMDVPQYFFGEIINGHRGGYVPIEFNITRFLNAPGEENKITVWAEDRGVYGQHDYVAMIGKQGREAPCGYLQTGGIWQTVMLESRGQTSIGYVHANPSVRRGAVNGSVTLDVEINNMHNSANQDVTVDFEFTPMKYNVAADRDEVTGSAISGSVNIAGIPAGQIVERKGALTIEIPNQRLWDVENPNLYYGTATLKIGGAAVDTVSLYFGQREVYVDVAGKDAQGRDYSYVHLNNKPVYQAGLLDQGFWVEGLYTAPSEAALRYDIESMKDRGFSMIRKHIKIEDPIEYTWADKLGMLIWADMPHVNAMMINEYNRGDKYAPGRDLYLHTLDQMLRRDYNRPSIIAVILFNETWGIVRDSGAATDNTYPVTLQAAHTFNQNSGGSRTLAAGTQINSLDENNWLAALYYHVKEMRPGTLVEDMSACNRDHINPTDMNTWHDYSKGYANVRNIVEFYENSTFPGSDTNFRPGWSQAGQPLLNSEYNSIGYGDWDFDISWAFKYYTDILRQQVKGGGYVYTEPHDIENERNGLVTWERFDKIMGYDEVAWGGDMSIADLNQPDYVGIDGNPITTVIPGATFSRNVIAMNWSGNNYPGATLKWRFDATDIYGNNISTGVSGSGPINYAPFQQQRIPVSFEVPDVRSVGTLTVWIEDAGGNKLAKNFQNVLVRPGYASAAAQPLGGSSYALRQVTPSSNTFTDRSGNGQAVYSFNVPAGFDPADLRNIRLLAEVSSVKPATEDQNRYLPTTHSEGSQTAVNYEKPSDMSVLVNGREVATVNIPDNPRDTRGTQALGAFVDGSSAGNFGYLVNLNLPDAAVAAIKSELAGNRSISVTFSVKADAANKNGLRIYNETSGRWAVMPTLLINPADLYADGSRSMAELNYAVETAMSDGQSFTVRGGAYTVAYENGNMVLRASGNTLGSASAAGSEVPVRLRLFDDKITMWVNGNPEPVFTVYDSTRAASGDINGAGLAFVISPESYDSSGASVPEEQAPVNLSESFDPAGRSASDVYRAFAGGTASQWTFGTDSRNPGTLAYTSSLGGRVEFANSLIKDGVVEADITLTGGTDQGNSGFVLHASDFADGGADNLHGYYVGIGRNNYGDMTVEGVPLGAGREFLQIGIMQNSWRQLQLVELGNNPVNYPVSHRLSVTMEGATFKVSVDGVERATFYDTTMASGTVGFRTYNAEGYVDNLLISNTGNGN